MGKLGKKIPKKIPQMGLKQRTLSLPLLRAGVSGQSQKVAFLTLSLLPPVYVNTDRQLKSWFSSCQCFYPRRLLVSILGLSGLVSMV